MDSNMNETPKGTNGCENTSFEPSVVQIAPKLWSVALKKERIDTLIVNPQENVFFSACIAH